MWAAGATVQPDELPSIHAESFRKLDDDRKEVVSGFADLVTAELEKPKPDTVGVSRRESRNGSWNNRNGPRGLFE
jgi:hypothetical protein